MTNPDRDDLVKLDETGLDAAVRECARITAPEISDDEYERIKTDNSPRYQNTRTEMTRAIRAYLRAANPALSSIVTCCVTGAIPGDGGACGDCDPCLLGEASVPSPVKTLIAEKNSLLHRVGELEDEIEPLRRLASSDGGVKGEPVAWVQPDKLYKDAEDEESGNVMAIDHQSGPFTKPLYTSPPADAGMREAFVRVLASLAAAISILERTPKAKKAVASDKMFDTMLDDYRKALEAGRQALTAPGATTESDGGALIPTLVDDPNSASGKRVEYQRPSDPSFTRSEMTVDELAEWLLDHLSMDARPYQDARALLDQFEIRRKK